MNILAKVDTTKIAADAKLPRIYPDGRSLTVAMCNNLTSNSDTLRIGKIVNVTLGYTYRLEADVLLIVD